MNKWSFQASFIASRMGTHYIPSYVNISDDAVQKICNVKIYLDEGEKSYFFENEADFKSVKTLFGFQKTDVGFVGVKIGIYEARGCYE